MFGDAGAVLSLHIELLSPISELARNDLESSSPRAVHRRRPNSSTSIHGPSDAACIRHSTTTRRASLGPHTARCPLPATANGPPAWVPYLSHRSSYLCVSIGVRSKL